MTSEFQPIDLDVFPKRKGRTQQLDVEAANALVNMLLDKGSVSDGILYEDGGKDEPTGEAKARVAAARAKRLAEAATVALPNGKMLRTRVASPIGQDGKFAFALILGDEPPPKKAPAKGK